ncbi:gametocyte-specific factor 1 homolog [Armigeres subalbatus]|uniref:gametocyte-specific factor 1 homolog n=1 Tax=Armigeres subalbatus TaxID=124917 RepID=UPI002ED3F9FA
MSHYEEVLHCPYNASHSILAHAMQRHLIKCRKNYPSAKLVKCPFNSIHCVPGPELNMHVEKCEDRATLDLYKYCISSKPSSKNSSYKDSEPELIYHDSVNTQGPSERYLDDGESWENSNTPAYSSQSYCGAARDDWKTTSKKSSDRQKFYREEHPRNKKFNTTVESKTGKPQTNCRSNNTAYDKPSFKGYRGRVPESKYYNEEPVQAPGKTLLDDDECWDDSDVPAYNPQEYCKNARVIRKATHMQPQQKKEFYRQESRRLKGLDGHSKNIGKDLDEISDKFRKSMFVGSN